MLVGYVRVSKHDMNLDRQIDALIEAGVNRHCIYQEKVTGTKRDRDELNKMLSELQSGETVIVSELSRLSRSTVEHHVKSVIKEFEAYLYLRDIEATKAIMFLLG